MSPQKSYSMGCFPVLPPATSQGAQTLTARGVGESREKKLDLGGPSGLARARKKTCKNVKKVLDK
jgi:hypothetical protein